MKKSLIALATLAAATGAFAQSSVTISGELDAGIKSTSLGNGKTPMQMGSGIHGASRLRFVGVEDLGGGNKANFWLEMQPNFETGSAATNDLFNRGAWLGASGGWGEIRLGRQGTNTIGAVCTVDQQGCYSGFYGGGILFSGQGAPGATGSGWILANPTRGGTQAASTNGSNNLLTSVDTTVDASSTKTNEPVKQAATQSGDSTRYTKAVRYSLPAFVTGLSINATYAYGTVASATAAAAGNTTGVDATYVSGPLAVVFAYQQADADAGKDQSGKLTTYGATYDLGVAKLGAAIQQETAAGTAVAFTKGDSYALTATVPMGALTPYVKFGEHKYSGGTLGSVTNAKMANVGVRYALSKRSLVYVDYVNNSAVVTGTAQKSMTSIGLQHGF